MAKGAISVVGLGGANAPAPPHWTGLPHPDAPRLEPATNGVGWTPCYAPGPVAPEPPPPELAPLDALAALFEATLPQLRALAETVAPQARRHAHAAVPGLLLADARAVLAAARQVLAREASYPRRLHLKGPAAWAELDAKLALALAGFGAF